jgi:hypothetical protein
MDGVWSWHVTFSCISVAKYNDWNRWSHGFMKIASLTEITNPVKTSGS